MICIGIGGPPFAGKDTAAHRLVERWGFHSKAFSELIADEFRVKHGRTPSKGEMQDYGSQRRAEKGDWYWVTQMAEWARRFTRVVIPGVRFPQEIEWIQRQSHWAIWRVESDTLIDPTGRDPDHATERSLDDFHGWSCTLRNDGEVEDLHDLVDAALMAWAQEKCRIAA